MSLTIIAAVAANGVIGNSELDRMPWHVSEELKFFKANTMDKTVVMGRKTAEQVGKLRGRDCIVLSKDPSYKLAGFLTLSLEQFLHMNEYRFDKEYAVAGGAEIYKQLMPYASFALISYMDFEAKGDVMMPKFDRDVWRKTSSTTMTRFTAIAYTNTNRATFNTMSK